MSPQPIVPPRSHFARTPTTKTNSFPPQFALGDEKLPGHFLIARIVSRFSRGWFSAAQSLGRLECWKSKRHTRAGFCCCFIFSFFIIHFRFVLSSTDPFWFESKIAADGDASGFSVRTNGHLPLFRIWNCEIYRSAVLWCPHSTTVTLFFSHSADGLKIECARSKWFELWAFEA